MNRILICIASLSAEVNVALTTREFWNDEMFIGLKLNPVAHEVMMIPRLDPSALVDSEPSELLLISEVLRLASIIFLCLLRRRFPAQPDKFPAYGPQLTQLTRLLATYALNKIDPNWYLWALVLAALVDEDEEVLVEKIVDAMMGLGISSWSEAIQRLKMIAWIPGICNYMIDDLERKVMSYILNQMDGHGRQDMGEDGND